MRGKEDRRAGWDEALVYADARGVLHSFVSPKKYTAGRGGLLAHCSTLFSA